ncbi:TPA: hypothetical protein ACH9WA_004079, partial [Escherichia coli]
SRKCTKNKHDKNKNAENNVTPPRPNQHLPLKIDIAIAITQETTNPDANDVAPATTVIKEGNIKIHSIIIFVLISALLQMFVVT